jgi:hypothetical protein
LNFSKYLGWKNDLAKVIELEVICNLVVDNFFSFQIIWALCVYSQDQRDLRRLEGIEEDFDL